MAIFASDNVTTACPEIMDALVKANSGNVDSYGDDKWSESLKKKMSDLFETNVEVFIAVTGTAANSLALSALTPGFGNIYCHEISHINVDECGAPEFFTGGAKLIALKGADGKITADDLQKNIRGWGVVHNTQPASVSITQACETGLVYQLDEVSAISELAHKHKMKVHMDGARFANSVATLKKTPAEMTWKAGVDVLTFGGTKNGCLDAEAIVFFKPEHVGNFPFLHKRSGQLLSKMRFVSAQLETYITNNLWLKNAEHSNSMAQILSKELSNIDGVKLLYQTQSNEIFANFSENIIKNLKKNGYSTFQDELNNNSIRFVTAWNTTKNDIKKLVSTISNK